MAKRDRPEFAALHRAVARKEVDLVAACSLDRLGRSLQDRIGFLAELQSKGVDLYLQQQDVDTSTPSGRAVLAMLGVFAECERSIIQERVKAGLARARACGRALGRPRVADEVEGQISALANKVGRKALLTEELDDPHQRFPTCFDARESSNDALVATPAGRNRVESFARADVRHRPGSARTER